MSGIIILIIGPLSCDEPDAAKKAEGAKLCQTAKGTNDCHFVFASKRGGGKGHRLRVHSQNGEFGQ